MKLFHRKSKGKIYSKVAVVYFIQRIIEPFFPVKYLLQENSKYDYQMIIMLVIKALKKKNKLIFSVQLSSAIHFKSKILCYFWGSIRFDNFNVLGLSLLLRQTLMLYL